MLIVDANLFLVVENGIQGKFWDSLTSWRHSTSEVKSHNWWLERLSACAKIRLFHHFDWWSITWPWPHLFSCSPSKAVPVLGPLLTAWDNPHVNYNDSLTSFVYENNNVNRALSCTVYNKRQPYIFIRYIIFNYNNHTICSLLLFYCEWMNWNCLKKQHQNAIMFVSYHLFFPWQINKLVFSILNLISYLLYP